METILSAILGRPPLALVTGLDSHAAEFEDSPRTYHIDYKIPAKKTTYFI